MSDFVVSGNCFLVAAVALAVMAAKNRSCCLVRKQMVWLDSWAHLKTILEDL
jgi:hypothetical protein